MACTPRRAPLVPQLLFSNPNIRLTRFFETSISNNSMPLNIKKPLAIVGLVVSVFSNNVLAFEIPEEDQLLDLILPIELIHEILKNEVSLSVIHGVYPEFRMPAKSFKEKDIEKIVNELDRISSVVTKDSSSKLGVLKIIAHQKFRGAGFDVQLRPLIAPGTPENELAKKHTQFVLSAKRALGFYQVFAKIAPEMVSSYAPNDLERLYAPFNFSRYVNRAAISTVLNGPGVKFLRNGTELQLLDQSLISVKSRMNSYNLERYRNWIDGNVISGVQTEWMKFVAAPANIETMKVEADLLRRRLDMLRDPNTDGRCERLMIRPDSIAEGQKNWRDTKIVGAPNINYHKIISLVSAFEFGCYVEKNFDIARNILERAANEHGDSGKLAGFTHCKAALWNLHGIGGPKNKKAAGDWVHRAKTEAGITCVMDKQLDPRDPWKMLQ